MKKLYGDTKVKITKGDFEKPEGYDDYIQKAEQYRRSRINDMSDIWLEDPEVWDGELHETEERWNLKVTINNI
ncbi:MAG: hypothetical protein R2809_12820 [Flavobacteriales bacterium]